MSSKHDREMTLIDGRDVLVDYVVDSYGSDPSGMFGPPEDYDPGSGPELYVEAVTLIETEEKIEISDAERQKLEETIIENPDWWMPDGDDYPDYGDD